MGLWAEGLSSMTIELVSITFCVNRRGGNPESETLNRKKPQSLIKDSSMRHLKQHYCSAGRRVSPHPDKLAEWKPRGYPSYLAFSDVREARSLNRKT